MFGCIFENALENTFSTSFSYSPNFQTNIIIENSNINPKKQEREREREREGFIVDRLFDLEAMKTSLRQRWQD